MYVSSRAASDGKKTDLADGFQVGILNLDNILKEVADLKINRCRNYQERNYLRELRFTSYVASRCRDYDYSTALFQEYMTAIRESR